MFSRKSMNRRGFLASSMAGAAGFTLRTDKHLIGRSRNRQKTPVKIKRYTALGRTGFKVSDIGFGAGILTNGAVLRAAIDSGLNYIDTAEHYVRGTSERVIGEVLKKVDRKSLFITTKLNLSRGGPGTYETILERFQKSLERMKTEYADCLMLHMARDEEQVGHEAFHKVASDLKADGRIRFIGLSNHGPEQKIWGNLEVPAEKIMAAAAEDGRYDVALFVYNFLQKDSGEKIIRILKDKNMGVTLMKTNPIKMYQSVKARMDDAGKNGREISKERLKIMEDYKEWAAQSEVFKKKYGLRSDEEARDAAIKFVIGHPDVHSACLSMNTFDDMESCIGLSGMKLESSGNSMLEDYDHYLGSFYCRHSCGLCESACPHQVPVNTVMRYNHYFTAQRQEKRAIAKYASMAGHSEAGSVEFCGNCVGHCESACPYGVKVQCLMIDAHENLTLT